jgi:hypothetical protein
VATWRAARFVARPSASWLMCLADIHQSPVFPKVECQIMRTAKLAIAGSVIGALLVGTAVSEKAAASDLRQPVSVHQTAFEYDNYLYFAPQGEAAESPSDQPAPLERSSAVAGGCVADCDASCGRSCGRCGGGCAPWTLPQPCFLARRGITVGGWTEVGISWTANRAADRFNGPVAFNDRDGEAQMNQLWFYLDRTADTGGYGWDVGGRIDFVYGTDAMFTQAVDGLEADWNQTERFYQAALPQLYLDVAYNDLTVRMGHFFSILGYETVPAPENFFYSHAYTMLFAEPRTLTGMLAIYELGDRLSVSAGVHRGLNQFEDTDGSDTLGFVGGVNWTSWNERMTLGFAISSSEQRPDPAATAPDFNVVAYSLVGTFDLTDRLAYVVQHDLIQAVGRYPASTTKADAFGVNQYLLYEINPCWAAGLRFEWFRDEDGWYVRNLREGDPITGTGFQGDFYEVTAGLNWTPRQNIIVRPEVRWDWFEADAGITKMPYDAGDRNSQFLFGCDLIVTY